MEASRQQESPKADIGGIRQQLSYPLDHVSTQIIREAIGSSRAFPVGSVFISVVSTDPSSLLGYGTWESFGAGRVMVGLDSGDAAFDTAEETGGSKTHTLTLSEMPSHSHDVYVGNSGSGSPSLASGGSTPSASSGYMTSAGSGAAFSVMNPYIVCYFWKRTA